MITYQEAESVSNAVHRGTRQIRRGGDPTVLAAADALRQVLAVRP